MEAISRQSVEDKAWHLVPMPGASFRSRHFHFQVSSSKLSGRGSQTSFLVCRAGKPSFDPQRAQRWPRTSSCILSKPHSLAWRDTETASAELMSPAKWTGARPDPFPELGRIDQHTTSLSLTQAISLVARGPPKSVVYRHANAHVFVTSCSPCCEEISPRLFGLASLLQSTRIFAHAVRGAHDNDLHNFFERAAMDKVGLTTVGRRESF
jgi:hypothetical protein